LAGVTNFLVVTYPYVMTEQQHAEPGFLLWVAELVHRHREPLLRFARSRQIDAESALDCVQEAFLSFMKLPQSRDIARDNDDAAKMLFVLLKHIISNHARTNKRREHLLAEHADELYTPKDSEKLIADAEHLGRIRGCILQMQSLQRAVIEMSLLDEASGQDIADALGISPGNVRVLLFRAREHIKQCHFET
jgi:RNA polymerase sigma-70 factor (ECF subfamily)